MSSPAANLQYSDWILDTCIPLPVIGRKPAHTEIFVLQCVLKKKTLNTAVIFIYLWDRKK